MKKLHPAAILALLALMPLSVSAQALHDIVTKGSTDRSVTVKIIDSTAGTPETGVVFNTAGIDMWYRREGAVSTDITEATLAALTTAHADGGFLHVNDGVYRMDLPDAAIASGANYVDFGGTVTGMIVIGGRIRLTDFTLETATQDVNVAQLSSDATAANNAEAFFDGTGYAGTGNVIPTVTTLTGHTAQTGDNFARLGAPAGASISADVAAVKVDTAATLVDTGTTLPARFTGVEGATFATGTDSLEAIRNRGDAAWATGSGTGLTPIASGTAQSATGTTLVLAAGETFANDELIGAMVQITGGTLGVGQSKCISGNVGATDTVTVNTWTTTPTGTITYEITPGVSDTCPETSTDIVDAWEAQSQADPTGFHVNVLEIAGTAQTANDNGADINASLADTNELQTDWVNGGRLDNLLDGAASAGDPWTTSLPGAYGAGTAGNIIGNNVDAAVSSRMAEASIDTTAGAIDNVTLVATTTTNTDMRGTDSAATAANLTTLDGKVDTIDGIVDSILVDTGTTLDGKIDSILLDTGTTLDGIVDAILLDTGTTLPSSIAAIQTVVDLLQSGTVLHSGTCDSGTTTTCVDALLTEDEDYWKGTSIVITSGSVVGQTSCVYDFVAVSDTLTFRPMTAAIATNSYLLVENALCEGVVAP